MIGCTGPDLPFGKFFKTDFPHPFGTRGALRRFRGGARSGGGFWRLGALLALGTLTSGGHLLAQVEKEPPLQSDPPTIEKTGQTEQTDKPEKTETKKDDKKDDKQSAKPRAAITGVENVPLLPVNALFPASINYHMWNTSKMSTLMLVGGRPVACVFDTGLSACTVSPDLATQLKLTPLPTQITVSSLNETRTVNASEVKAVKFNGMTLDLPRVAVLDASELYTGQPQPGAPGIWLGTPFFAAFQVTIDYEHSIILLDSPTAKLPKLKNAVILPIKIHDGRILTQVSIPEVGSFPAIIDTGSLGTLIPSAIAAKLKIPPRKTFTVSRPNGKVGHASLVFLPILQLGELEQEQVPALYFEMPPKSKPTPKTKNTATSTKSKPNTDGGSATPPTGVPPANPAPTPQGVPPATTTPTATTVSQTTTPPVNGTPSPQNGIKPVGAGTVAPPVTPEPAPEILDETIDYKMAVIGNDILKHYTLIFNLQQHKLILVPPEPKPGDLPPVKVPDKKTPPSPRNGKKSPFPQGTQSPSGTQ